MTIRSKLYTAIAVAIAGLALTAGVGIWAMADLSDRFDAVQRAGDDRALALQLKFGVTDVNGWQTAYGYDDGASRGIFVRSVAAFRSTLRRADVRFADAGSRALLADVRSAFADFMRVDGVAFAALQKGDKAAVRRLFLGPEIANFKRAAAAAEKLARFEDARAGAEERTFRNARRNALRYLIVASVIAGLLVAVLLAAAVDLARAAERRLSE